MVSDNGGLNQVKSTDGGKSLGAGCILMVKSTGLDVKYERVKSIPKVLA